MLNSLGSSLCTAQQNSPVYILRLALVDPTASPSHTDHIPCFNSTVCNPSHCGVSALKVRHIASDECGTDECSAQITN